MPTLPGADEVHAPALPDAWLATHPAVVFDLDGTLVDTLPDLTGALDEALEAIGLPPVHPEVVMDSLHGGLAGTAAAVAAALGLDAPLARRLRIAYEEAYAEAPARRALPFVGVLECLHALRAAGCRLAVCTNKSQSDAERVLEALGLAFAFDTIVGAGRGFALKPDPQPLLHAVQHLGHPPGRAVLVGDSLVDALCARRAGVRFAHFAGGYGGAEAEAAPADARFASYSTVRQDRPR